MKAQEAKRIADEFNQSMDDKANEVLNEILERVKTAASKGEHSIKERSNGFGSSFHYSNKPEGVHKEVIDKLKELGYNVKIGSESSQFVDIWLDVSW